MSQTVQDPDVGPTKQQPSTQEKLDSLELTLRASKIQHLRKQGELLEEANGLTAYPAEQQAVVA